MRLMRLMPLMRLMRQVRRALAATAVALVLVAALAACRGQPPSTATPPSVTVTATARPVTPTGATPEADWLAQSRALLTQGQYRQAQALLEQYLADDPGSAEAHFLLGNAHYGLGNLDGAAEQYQTAVELAPDYGAAHLNLGVVYYIQSGPAAGPLLDQAVEEFERAVALEPDVADNWYMQGAAYLVQATSPDGRVVHDATRLEQALASFQHAIARNSGFAPAYVGLGNIALLQRDFSLAVTQLELATQLDASLPEAWFALGKAYQGAGSNDQGLAAYQAYVALNPPHAENVAEAQRAITELQRK